MIVLGSLHPDELQILLPCIKRIGVKVKILIAPRNLAVIDKFVQVLLDAEIQVERRSELTGGRSLTSCLLLDTFGELSACYSLAVAAFVGGTLDPRVGGHNPLEPLRFGIPVIIGPHFRNIQEIVQELSEKGIFIGRDSREIQRLLLSQVNDMNLKERSKMVSEFFAQHSGALTNTVDMIRKIALF